MARATILKLLALAGLVVLAGCDQLDPMLRTDRWQPTGANAGNIAAMVANPQDLIRGHGDIFRETNDQALAAGHILNDQPKPLAQGQGSSSGSSGGGGGGGSGGSGSPGS